MDLLFSRRCSACEGPELAPDLPFCPACAATLQPVQPDHACRRCAMPLEASLEAGREVRRCRHCAAWPAELSSVRAPFEYGGALAEAIIALKWQARDDLAQPLARLWLPLFELRLAGCDVVVPVPLHPLRLRERGYNQAHLLAQAGLAALPAALRPSLQPQLLQRHRPDPPTRHASQQERVRRTRDAFFAPQPRPLTGKRVLLIDDVVTTGATLSACALALHRAGARQVTALTLARTV